MFSGIVETMAQIVKIEQEQTNKHFTLRNPYGEPLSIDQSIAHNGVCLTVVKMEGDLYTVTAMQETLNRTNLGEAKEGDWVNLERSMLLGERLDGHIVQGHVDQTARCIEVKKTEGSWSTAPITGTTPMGKAPTKRSCRIPVWWLPSVRDLQTSPIWSLTTAGSPT